MPISDPPSAGRYLLHFPADDRCAPAPALVDVSDRGDGVLVWTDPHTGSIFGTGPGFPRLSSAYRWERAT
jgi:hypothetical protein